MVNIITSISNCKTTIDTSGKNIITKSKSEILWLLSLELDELRVKLVKFSKNYEGFKAITYSEPEKWLTPQDWFDCSWFITFILWYFWLWKEWVRHANEYFDSYGVFVHNPIPWDIIFFSSNWNIPTHIWLYIWNDEYLNKNWNTIKIDKLIKEPIKWLSKRSLYVSNPIWFKRINIEVQNFTNERWRQVI